MRNVSKKIRKERAKTSLFLIPSMLGVAVFFIIPFFIVIYYAMLDNPVSARFVGFDNFVKLFGNSSFRLAAKNTAVFSAIALPLAIVLPLLLASLLLNKLPGKSVFRTILISPYMVPTASVILVFNVIFSYNGALNAFLSNFGLEAVDWLGGAASRYIVIFL